MMRGMIIALALAGGVPTITSAAMTPRGVPVPVSCTGPLIVEGKRIAKANALPLGLAPNACFGSMQIYDGPDRQVLVVAPSKACRNGQALDVFGKSRAGPWYSFFEKPLCASKLSIGPKNPWGDWMLTIDGKHYDSQGAYYVAVKY